MQACENVNTWPVLASPDDDAVLGAAYMLPDHPQVAEQSKGDLFDNTEIEEALLLHVHALSDAEREEIAGGDPAVREMVERAGSTTPDEILSLHGVMQPTDHGLGRRRSGPGGPASTGARRGDRVPGVDRAPRPR